MLRVAKHVISEILNGEVVMINLGNGAYYCMSGSTSLIWEEIVAGTERRELTRLFAGDGAHTDETARAIDAFVDSLVAEELVEEVAAERSDRPDDGPTDHGTDRPRLGPLVFEKFTDMTEILLTDPVHEIDPAKGWPTPR